jgi:fructokinase
MIVSCGEALIDFLPRTGPNGERYFQPLPGGSPFNVAIALGRLGAKAGFFGGLSSDFFGTLLRDALKASRVDLSLVHPTDRPSTLAFVSLDNGNARYAFFDEASAGRMLTEADLPALPKDVAALHFGSFSLAEEPCGSALEALMHGEQRARVISLDPNIRPTLVKNRDAHIARLDRLVAMADIVKLSEDDLAWLAPDTTPEVFVRRWLDHGAKLVILTKGEQGTLATTRHVTVTTPAVIVEVADTVGAGDTFTAATLARLDKQGLLTKHAIADLDEDQLSDVAAFAAKAASITVSRAGANPPWAEELGA